MNDDFYRAFEDRFRGSSELIKSRLQVYLPFILPLLRFYPSAKAIDLGCGRGEWLGVLTDNGFEAEGVDLDDAMLSACRECGLSVHTGDAVAFLLGLPDQSQVIVSGFHIAEHLPFETLQALVKESLRVLLPGGLLILETPNPENLVIGTSAFYLDPTHQKPLPPQLLAFLPEYAGFKRSKVVRLQEAPDLAGVTHLSLLNVLNGVSPDYAVVAQKDGSEEMLTAWQSVLGTEYGLTLETLANRYQQQIEIKVKHVEAKAQQAEAKVQQAEAVAALHIKELRTVYSSRSWRMTAPLRWYFGQMRLLRADGFSSRLKALVRKSLICLDKALLVRPALRRKLLSFSHGLGVYHILKKTHAGPIVQPLSMKIQVRRGGPVMFLDVSVIVINDAKSGIQRVVRSLLQALLNDPPEGIDVCAIYFKEGRYFEATCFNKSNKEQHDAAGEDTLVQFMSGDIYLALDLNLHLVDAAKDEHARMKQIGVQMNFIIYDILLVRHPEWWISGMSESFTKWLESVVCMATKLVCISDAVAKDLKRWIAENPLLCEKTPQIVSFHLGGDVINSAPSRGLSNDSSLILSKLALTPSFLMVGTVEPRKGHAQVLAAFEILWDQGLSINLVIVGKFGWLVEELAEKLRTHPEAGRRLYWLEGISDEYLAKVYKISRCLIAASYAEGFGLPMVEAANEGIPILARDIEVFREVAGIHATYFHAENAEDLACAIQDWLINYNNESVPQSKSVTLLTWSQSANQLKAVLDLAK